MGFLSCILQIGFSFPCQSVLCFHCSWLFILQIEEACLSTWELAFPKGYFDLMAKLDWCRQLTNIINWECICIFQCLFSTHLQKLSILSKQVGAQFFPLVGKTMGIADLAFWSAGSWNLLFSFYFFTTTIYNLGSYF